MNRDDLRKRADRLNEVNEIIKHLEPEVRGAAFVLLEDYVTGSDQKGKAASGSHEELPTPEDRHSFFSQFDTEKPAENALLLAAYHYKQYGAEPFSADELKVRAGEVGLVLPERVDMTIRQARRDGKSLFQSVARGTFRPTVHGELFFRNTYRVSRGTELKPAESAEHLGK